MNRNYKYPWTKFTDNVKSKFWICVVALTLIVSGGVGCKKFLNVDGLEALSGNNFWQDESDVESYTVGTYALMRLALLNSIVYPMAGDWRFGPWIPNSGAPGGSRDFISLAADNDLWPLFNTSATYAGSNQSYWVVANAIPLTWKYLYQTIAAANILYEKVDAMTSDQISDASKRKYKAEAVYLRCLSYFFLVRFFGDVPYYTNAYNSEALKKTDMVTVFKNCVEELRSVKDDLPWTYSDPANVGVRAMRGGAMIMMMEMDMWLANFNSVNETEYWTDVDTLGESLINDNGGVYSLIPIAQYPTIFRGKSSEALIELSRNANYNESNYSDNSRNFTFGSYVVYRDGPKSTPTSAYYGSYSYADGDFMSDLYPTSDGGDLRRTLWYDNYNAETYKFQGLKYCDLSLTNGTYSSPGLLINRFADAYLLRAEALADLGKDNEAITLLNVIRDRAGAAEYTASSSGGESSTGYTDLQEAIWNERVKEFLLEGHYAFDLIRTKRVTSSKYTVHPITLEDYNNRAWTWPIPTSAFSNNPYMTQNAYWNQ